MLLHSRKGSTEDLVLPPLFVIGIALGIVLLVLLHAIYSIGSSDEFEKRFVATDLALLIDSLYAVRPDVTLTIQYPPVHYQGIISANTVTVFSKNKDDGKAFFFTEDPAYRFQYGSWLSEKPITLYKTGNDLGVGELSRLKPYCTPSTKTFGLAISEEALRQSTLNWAEKSGKPAIMGTITPGRPSLKLFVNQNKDSELIACRIAQTLFEKMNDLTTFAIIPFSTAFLHDDAQKTIAASPDIGIFIELTTQKPNAKSDIYTALQRGING